MAKNMHYSMLFLLLSIFFHVVPGKCKTPLAPALYVFGDSLTDSGNNNFLQTAAKVNYTPYGIDFPSGSGSGSATGRFTNGKTYVDVIAELLGLPLVPAYLSLSTADKSRITTGVNYASGSAGILPESGTAIGDNLSLDEQINYFQQTLLTDLKDFETPDALVDYLSKSIFMVNIGSNDYINNYLQPANYRSSEIYNPEEFADHLIDSLKERLQKLYSLGARKFVVHNIGRIGCAPAIVNAANPKLTTPCAEDVNNLILLYNTKLPSMITALENRLSGSTFVRGDMYNMNANSYEAGFIVQQTPCCIVDDISGLCLPGSTPCLLRSAFLFWDAYHPSQIVNSGIGIDCFGGFFSCAPINILQLAISPRSNDPVHLF